jgi:LIVCS family branched-chain amino acid:cation transporter
MNKTKVIIVIGFALFSLFFGAGDLILPPFLGFHSGSSWGFVAFGFFLTAVLIPVLGLLAHSKLQGTMFDFAKKVSPKFSFIYCIIVYIICVLLPSPRTASVTHEMAIAPYFNSSPLLTSLIYFGLVFLFVINRSKVIDLIGKFLTPLIILILLIIIFLGVFSSPESINPSTFKSPLVIGLLEGYQTYGAIGSIVVGGVVIISINLKGESTKEEKKEIIRKSAFVAGTGLFMMYTGLIIIGAYYNTLFDANITRTSLLSGLSIKTLGNLGTSFLSVLVALACFTTAVGIVTGVSDYFKGLFKESQLVYTITAIISCVFGVLVGSYEVGFIIEIAIPALMFIYPITIILILLNVLPDQYGSKLVFRSVVLVTFLFSIPDFLSFLVSADQLQGVIDVIPFAQYNLGWVLPALTVFLAINLFQKNK